MCSFRYLVYSVKIICVCTILLASFKNKITHFNKIEKHTDWNSMTLWIHQDEKFFGYSLENIYINVGVNVYVL